MRVLRHLTAVICGTALLLANGTAAGPAQEKFAAPPAAGQLRARAAVAAPQLVACELKPAFTVGLMARTHVERPNGSLPDLSGCRDVAARKTRFFNYMLPLVQAENERLSAIRTRLRHIRDHVRWHRQIERKDREWLARVADEYGLTEGDPLRPEFWTAVFERVDMLPEDLVLVQAANESAWGTSRFAREGNNLFGQWCFGEGCGIVPADRPAGASYEVARYATVGESVGSYMHNLNTGRTYQLMREIRAGMRHQGIELDASELAAGLLDYSARGMEYVVELRAMIRQNQDVLRDLRQANANDGNS